MASDADIVAALDLASAVLLGFLGLFVGWKGRFQGKYAAFAVYAMAFGLGVGINNSANVVWGVLDGAAKPWPYFAAIALSLLSLPVVGWALVRLITTTGGFPHAAWWVLGGGVVAGAATTAIALAAPWPGMDRDLVAFGHVPNYAGMGFRNGMMAMAACVFGWRAGDRADRDQEALMGLAILLYPVMHTTGLGFLLNRLIGDPVLPWMAVLGLVMAVALTAVWLRAAVCTGSKRLLAVALLVPVLAIVGMAATSRVAGISMASVSRTLEVLLLAYAVSRGQFLGLDTKVRWGISKTTVAAVFIAVSFVVSEGAAALFSQKWGAGFGLAAAGALVFAIAPMLRWADRLAERAVPLATPAPATAEEQFARAVRIVSADGHVSPEEEAELGRLADDLGLSGGTAIRLRRLHGG